MMSMVASNCRGGSTFEIASKEHVGRFCPENGLSHEDHSLLSGSSSLADAESRIIAPTGSDFSTSKYQNEEGRVITRNTAGAETL